MKKLLTILLLTMSIGSKAQLSWQPAQTIDSLNNLWIYSVTCTGCWTHWHQGAVGDSIAQALDLLHSWISGASGLNAVLTDGNIDSNQQIIGQNAMLAQTMLLDPSATGNFVFGNASTYNIQMQVGSLFCRSGTTPLISLLGGSTQGIIAQRSTSGSDWFIAPSSLSANRSALWPDEGNGTGIPSTVMLHTTKYPVIINNATGLLVNDGSGNTSVINGNTNSVQDGVGDYLSMSANGTGTNSFMQMSNSFGGRMRLFYSGVGSLNQYFFEDRGGGVDSIALKSDVSAGSIQWNQASKRWNGDYTQRVAAHILDFDSVNNLTVSDTNGNDVISMNGSAGAGTMLYVNSNVNFAQFGTKGFTSGSFSSSYAGGTKSMSSQNGSGNSIFGSSRAGIDYWNIRVGGTTTFATDSATSSDTIGHAGWINNINGRYNLPTNDGPAEYCLKTNGTGQIGYVNTPTIVQALRSVNVTNSTATFTTYAVGPDGSYWVSANVNITTSTVFNFTVTCTYTDETGTLRTQTMPFVNLAGTVITAITNAAGATAYEGVPIHIRCQALSTITVATAGTVTGVVYNFEDRINSEK